MPDLFDTPTTVIDSARPAGSRVSEDRPLRVDAWVASSLLQKTIRRGDADMAERAALAFYRLRGTAIWRRFKIIAYEDIGAGSTRAVIEAVNAGGDEQVAAHVARLLAGALKDRSAEHLLRVCRAYPGYEDVREAVGAASNAQRLRLVADNEQPLHVRSTAAWYASGVDLGDEKRLGEADLPGLLDAFRSIGIPDDLVTATGIAARKTRVPLTIVVPLIWQTAFREAPPIVANMPGPNSPLLGDVPAYAYDKHTSLGKRAIHVLAKTNAAVRTTLEMWVPDYRALEAACMAAFYVDGAHVSRRLDWAGSRELEQFGTEQDLIAVGVHPSGVAPLLAVMRDNLDDLNAIRLRLHLASKGGRASA
jgi:hypothetical protein